MAQLNEPFDPNAADDALPTSGPLPAGWYTMQIVGDDMKTTKRGDGAYLELTFEIVESAHPNRRGRRVWDRLNLSNPNPKAVQIANAKLARLAKAVGHLGLVQDTTVLHFRALDVQIEVRESEQYGPSNEVRDYAPAGSRTGTGTAPANHAPQQGKPEGRGNTPWGK